MRRVCEEFLSLPPSLFFPWEGLLLGGRDTAVNMGHGGIDASRVDSWIGYGYCVVKVWG